MLKTAVFSLIVFKLKHPNCWILLALLKVQVTSLLLLHSGLRFFFQVFNTVLQHAVELDAKVQDH